MIQSIDHMVDFGMMVNINYFVYVFESICFFVLHFSIGNQTDVLPPICLSGILCLLLITIQSTYIWKAAEKPN